MANDRREDVMIRLVEIAQSIVFDGVAAEVFRNQQDVGEPAGRTIIALYDGDESASEIDIPGAHQSTAPNLVTMRPEIYLTASAQAENVGSRVNALRVAFLKALLYDSTLAAVCGSERRVRYDGCTTALTRGRKMESTMGVSVSFTYPLKPTEL